MTHEKDFYQPQLGYLMRPEINWAAAITFYLLLIVGIVIFAIKPRPWRSRVPCAP